MNKHFEDAWYYVGRAADHLWIGLHEELQPVFDAIDERFGDEDETAAELTGFDRVRTELETVRRDPVGTARERFEEYRERQPAE